MITFLLKATAISLSGVMAPGPMTAATLAAGARRRHAGAMIALGHAVVEFPLMLIIIAGAGKLFEIESVKLGIGLTGGAFLLLMGVQLLTAAGKAADAAKLSDRRHPLLTGIILTGANPYFLIWWATIGLALATQAAELGIMAFVLFAVIHWLCDLVWLEVLSLTSYMGTELLGGRLQQIVLVVCGLTLLGFGCMFLADAGSQLMVRTTGG
ncbi:MAG: LysE family transporter [Planctomycetes bacterium]|nr:LysE family transporter [Planctomycetota bacterium]